MESHEKSLELNVKSLIQRLSQSPKTEAQKKQKKSFPYVETYLSSINEEGRKFSKSSKFRESFFYKDTLKFSNPHFSFRKIFAPLEQTKTYANHSSTKPEKPLKTYEKYSRNLNTHKKILIANESLKKMKELLVQKSKIRKALNRSTKIKTLPKLNHDNITENTLKVNRIACKSVQNSIIKHTAVRDFGQQGTAGIPKRKRRVILEIDGALEASDSEYTRGESRISSWFVSP